MLLSALNQNGTERITVVLENGTEIRSSLSVVTELRLFPGKDLNEQALSELITLSRLSQARETALEMVSRRPMSCGELEKRLLEKGTDAETAASCVAWMGEHRFLDDLDYARRIVRHYAGKNYGEGRIRAELGRRLVPRELWEEALEEYSGADEKLDAYISSRLKDPANRDEVRKLSNALYRRGYDWSHIRAALQRHCDSIYEESI